MSVLPPPPPHAGPSRGDGHRCLAMLPGLQNGCAGLTGMASIGGGHILMTFSFIKIYPLILSIASLAALSAFSCFPQTPSRDVLGSDVISWHTDRQRPGAAQPRGTQLYPVIRGGTEMSLPTCIRCEELFSAT